MTTEDIPDAGNHRARICASAGGAIIFAELAAAMHPVPPDPPRPTEDHSSRWFDVAMEFKGEIMQLKADLARLEDEFEQLEVAASAPCPGCPLVRR